MLRDLFYLNKNLKKTLTIASPVINKFEIDISLRRTNIYVYSLNKGQITLVMNALLSYVYGNMWRGGILTDITCIDYLKNLNKYDLTINSRFKLKYTFNNINNQDYLNFYVPIRDKLQMFSLEKIIPSSVWSQREIWDMYGLMFQGASDLRRILTDYGFKSFPLRADFPVFGNLEIYYDIEMSELLYKKIDAAQENRFFGYNRTSFWF